MHLGIAHHLGWVVAVTGSGPPSHEVVDRRRIELGDADLPAAPIHHEGGTWALHGSDDPPDDEALAALVERVRASAVRLGGAALDDLPGPIATISLRAWPVDFPTDIAVLRHPPHEAKADSVMYRQVLAELAAERGWAIHLYDDKTVEADAAARLGARADEVLKGPRTALGPPWAKDHRQALAATVLAST